MSDHLPECPLLEPCDDDVPEHGYCSMQRGAFCIHCHQWCICDRLRACEQRVRQETDREAFTLDEGDPYREAYRAGYRKGVRDAHESASWCQDPDEMLQAIIGLLNMPPPPPLPPSVGVPEKWRP